MALFPMNIGSGGGTVTVTTVSLTQSIAAGGGSKNYTFDLSNEANEVLGVQSISCSGATRMDIVNNSLSISGTTLSITISQRDSSSKNVTLTMDVAIIAK